jgi:hypothetical protein
MLAIPWELVAAELHHHGLDIPPASPVLSVAERRLVEAIVAQIIPGDADSPGAREAGVVDFIERALGSFFTRFAAEFRTELASFETSFASARPGTGAFADHPVDEQIAWLERIQSSGFFAMLRQFTAGMPVFGSAQEFVQTVQGAGMYGKLLFETLHIPPIKFQSPAEAAKNFTTESKVFSIYATGEVKGFGRTTRIRMHTVVDFRSAQQLPGSLGAPGAPGTAGTAAPGIAATPMSGERLPGTPGAPGTDPLAALNTTPAGSIVYHRIE